MDDDLVLNIATEPELPARKGGSGSKGGRWTERAKAKRAGKRKERPDEPSTSKSAAQRPLKKPRASQTRHDVEGNIDEGPRKATATAHSQVISSLFTSNPRVGVSTAPSIPRPISRPSNAPLDSSTFTGLGLDPLIVAHLESKMNISKPTSIQRAALPTLLSSLTEDTSSRDVFIQSQTGSGKTLSFLLPILQDLLPLSSHSYIDRSIGTLAIIIAPTRELAKQISDVLEILLTLRLRPAEESADEPGSGPRLTRWLVSGLLTGGMTRTHEKARLRKGLPILVATPGRLLDHLQNTSSFNVGKCRWLVLDEADRLMELGFEESINGIIKGLDGRHRLAKQAVEEGKSMEVGGWDWNKRRRTVLCSATIKEDVQKLAGTTLKDPIVIKATQDDKPQLSDPSKPAGDLIAEAAADNTKFTPPSQLSQKYLVVPLKLRLVTLIALLRSLLAQTQGRRATKIIVFLSCTDSVDFHWHLLRGTAMDDETDSKRLDSDSDGSGDDDDEKDDEENTKPKKVSGEKVGVQSPLLPDASVFRLHGSLPLQTRLASLRGFSTVHSSTGDSKSESAQSSILLCTSVASRGLDLPLVRAVVQYDLPTESGATEYVHRVGRTARVGKGGEAWSFVSPSEVEWVKWVEAKMQGDSTEGKKSVSLEQIPMETVLQKGFGGKGRETEDRATEVQLSFERWVLHGKENAEFARKAFRSHVRAYATHPSDEKHIFHVRHLHLGHLAKAFALREAPSSVTGGGSKNKSKSKSKTASSAHRKSDAAAGGEDVQDHDVGDAERRMEQVVRAQGRLTKKGGKMVSSGTSEFQIAGGYDLEKLVQTR
ncbi:P-loop containing nucleoside triphosphate hydrolase protein [Irpex rosettiformis]|uniref:P-loop containing nucleoside triphosphate hydrolase protein n=1 Tax=Irpex rosettiformis TaxID=378272 RepID=A0ACB8UFS6_9APHY|nr:P-loop containing nucleoside triphosphate hydrolase protein [Irpex rosettiformis]